MTIRSERGNAYKQCGENRLGRLHRIASGDCQMGQDAYAPADNQNIHVQPNMKL